MKLLAAMIALSSSTALALDPADSLPPPPRQTAGDVPLSEPIAPVPQGLASWAFALSTLAGVADPFYDKVVLLASIRHGTGHWAVEAFGGRAFSWTGPALDICTAPGTCTTPGAQKLGATPGALGYIGGLAAVWRAGAGKLTVGGLAPMKFSVEAHLGAGAVTYSYDTTREETAWSPAARAGVGVEAGLPRDMAVRLELQGLFYRSDILGPEFDRELLVGASVAWQPGRNE